MTERSHDTPGLVPTIHARGAERLDAVVDLVHALARPRPLTELLDEVPRRVAAVFRSAVCSLYLREGDGLVMRGNVGFTATALGEVRLHVGEGIVGMCVECMRPVSVDAAPSHARFRNFTMLDEGRYPMFLAVPVPGAAGPAGALVVQRAEGAYTPQDIELLMALGGAIAPLLERARIVAGSAAPRTPQPTTGTRRVTIPGRPVAAGRALGMLTAVRRPAPRAAHAPNAPVKESARTLEKAIVACEATLDMHARAAQRRGLDASCLQLGLMLLSDGRLRERALELTPGRGLVAALAQVAREATRTARVTHEPMLAERAEEMSELCDALRVLVTPEGTAGIPRGAVWVGETVTVFELLVAARAKPCALVLTEAITAQGRSLVELMGIPTVAEATGIYNWAADGDVALVDGDHGLVRVNPSRRERDLARAERDDDDG